MRVECGSCGAVYNIPVDKLTKTVSRTTCRVCSYVIEIRKPMLQSNVSLDSVDLGKVKPKISHEDERTLINDEKDKDQNQSKNPPQSGLPLFDATDATQESPLINSGQNYGQNQSKKRASEESRSSQQNDYEQRQESLRLERDSEDLNVSKTKEASGSNWILVPMSFLGFAGLFGLMLNVQPQFIFVALVAFGLCLTPLSVLFSKMSVSAFSVVAGSFIFAAIVGAGASQLDADKSNIEPKETVEPQEKIIEPSSQEPAEDKKVVSEEPKDEVEDVVATKEKKTETKRSKSSRSRRERRTLDEQPEVKSSSSSSSSDPYKFDKGKLQEQVDKADPYNFSQGGLQ